MNVSQRNFLFFICLFIFTTVDSIGQSKFEFGVGLGINHSKLNDDIRTQLGPVDSQYNGLRLPSVMTRIGYKINDRFHLNAGPGFSWLGGLRKDKTERMIATTLEIPLQLEYNLRDNIHISSGPIYNYIAGIENETDQSKFNMLQLVDSRHQLGFRHGLAFSHKLIEISLSYSHYLTDVFNFAITDVNGNTIGSSVSRFRNIQLGFIFRR